MRVDVHTHVVPPGLKCLVAQFGADRVVLGSDYPFDMGDPDPARSLAAAGLDAPANAAIEGATAARFLGP
ncbi:MAG: amidohydrolase family protein [Candidatus Rokuibacteriota bacterium]